MNKYEIETAILSEFAQFMQTIEHLPFDKALPKIRKEAWRLADKYDMMEQTSLIYFLNDTGN